MKELIGKTINKIFLDEDYLTFEVDDGEIITYGVWGDCCSSSVWYDFYGVGDLLGKKVKNVKDVELTEDDFFTKRLYSIDKKVDRFEDSIQIYGVSLYFEDKYGDRTATVSFRNYSNGYYGGEYALETKGKRSTNEIHEDVIETLAPLKE